MTSFRINLVQWPVLFISKDDTFFQVAKNGGGTARHAFDDVQKWLSSDVARHARGGRAVDGVAELAGIDAVDRERRKLKIVSGHGGLSVRRSLDAELVPEETLLGRIGAVLELLEAVRAADPELAGKELPRPDGGYADYLDLVAGLLQHASDDHEPVAATGPARITAEAGRTRTTVPTGQAAFQIATPPLGTPTTTQPTGAVTELAANRHVIPDSRGWLHNLMHQAWG